MPFRTRFAFLLPCFFFLVFIQFSRCRCVAWRRLIHFSRPPSPLESKPSVAGLVRFTTSNVTKRILAVRRVKWSVVCEEWWAQVDSNQRISFYKSCTGFASLRTLVGPSGLEPPTSRLSVVRSNQLSYGPKVVEISGFEPLTPCLQSRCSPS